MSWYTYLTHLSVVVSLLGLLHKCSLRQRAPGQPRQYKQSDVSRCDQSSYDIWFLTSAPSLPTPTPGKTDYYFQE